MGYFPQWGLYDDPPYRVKDLVENGGAALLDQINYAQGFVTDGHCSVADPRADLGTTYAAADAVSGRADDPASPFRGYLHQLQELKQRYPHLRLVISLEGKAASFAEDARPENRRAFVASCVDRFLRGKLAPGVQAPGLFDGFDIDWEYPQEADAANYRALLEEFRRQMHAARPGAFLSVAVGPSPHMMPGTDFHAISRLVNEIGVMNYDYTGPWSARTGFLAPLFASAAGGVHTPSIAGSMERYEAVGVRRRKLLMGLPFYGYSWTGVSAENDGLFQLGRGVHGDEPWRHIRTLAAHFSVYRDPVSHAAWLFNGNTFWTFDDPVSIRYKASFAEREHLGGVMIWELSEDTPQGQLLHDVSTALRHPLPRKALQPAASPQPHVETASELAAPDATSAEAVQR